MKFSALISTRTCHPQITRLFLLSTIIIVAGIVLTILSSAVEGASISLKNNSSLALENNRNNNSLTSPHFDDVTTNQAASDAVNSSTSNSSSTLADLNEQEEITTTTSNKSKCHPQQLNNNGTCLPHNGKSLATLLEALPFLPIGIVLSLMFFCLCLVLRLFSKARFRDNRSSIFVNPQTLKVAQAQERRLSQLSQLSGHSSGHLSCRTPRSPRSPRSPRTPTRSPAHSYHSRSARSSYGSNVYPINDPAAASNLHTPTSSVLMKAKSRSNSISSSKLLP